MRCPRRWRAARSIQPARAKGRQPRRSAQPGRISGECSRGADASDHRRQATPRYPRGTAHCRTVLVGAAGYRRRILPSRRHFRFAAGLVAPRRTAMVRKRSPVSLGGGLQTDPSYCCRHLVMAARRAPWPAAVRSLRRRLRGTLQSAEWRTARGLGAGPGGLEFPSPGMLEAPGGPGRHDVYQERGGRWKTKTGSRSLSRSSTRKALPGRCLAGARRNRRRILRRIARSRRGPFQASTRSTRSSM